MQKRAGLFLCTVALASCVDAAGPKGGHATLDGNVGEFPAGDRDSSDVMQTDDLAVDRPEDAGFDEPPAPDDAPTGDSDAPPPHDGGMPPDGGAPPIGRPQLHDAGPSISHPLDPFRLDCASLPTNEPCQGGPNEVLLVTSSAGHVAMFDAYDGQYLGYFLHPSASQNNSASAYEIVTQGPDQCLWSLAGESVLHPPRLERWDAESTQVATVMEKRDDGGLQDLYFPAAIGFTANHLYTASSSGLARWTLAGAFDRRLVRAEEGVGRFLVLGDGSIVFINGRQLRQISAQGGPSSPLIVSLEDFQVEQLAYAGQGTLLVSALGAYDGLYEVELASGEATKVVGTLRSEVVASLRTGGVLWKMAHGGDEFEVSNPLWDGGIGYGTALLSSEMAGAQEVGRACLSDAFLARHATRPAQNTCIAPPEGPSLLEENFNGSDDFVGVGDDRHYKAFYSTNNSAVTATLEVVPNEGDAGMVQGDGSRALKITGSFTGASLGVHADLTGDGPHRPRYVSFRVMVGPTYALERLRPGIFDLQEGATARTLSLARGHAERWTQIELRNIDWNQRTYDLYVDCVRESEGLTLPPLDQVDRLLLYNVASSTRPSPQGGVAWFDDIIIK